VSDLDKITKMRDMNWTPAVAYWRNLYLDVKAKLDIQEKELKTLRKSEAALTKELAKYEKRFSELLASFNDVS